MTRIAVVPSAPALLPSYAGLLDPLPKVRSAALAACAWLAEAAPRGVDIVGDDLGRRVGEALLARSGATVGAPVGQGATDALLVVADGTARRGEKAPGHLDDRAHAYDADIARALASGDAAALEKLDPDLGAELLARGVPALRALGALAAPMGPVRATLDHEGDPYGVAYWVVRWEVGSR